MAAPTPKQIAAAFAAVAIILPSIAGTEGKRNVPYQDTGGVWTDCYGHTGSDVAKGKVKTDEECSRSLARDAVDHALGVSGCVPIDTPLKVQAAFTDITYNIGVVKFCSSTMATKARSGDFKGACAEFAKWVYVGKKDCRVRSNNCYGIVTRRAWERSLCEEGLR